MKLRSLWLIRVIAGVGAFFVWCWMSTMRIRITSLDGRQHPTDPAKERFFYAFWHEGLLAPLAVRAKIQMLISQHADGELIAQVCQWLGYGVVRGSTTRGGCDAIQGLLRGSESATHLGITPDGPRGPRRKLQLGIIWVASTTGMPIVLIGIGFAKAWRANSWDRFAVPIPFSSMCGVMSEPIHIPPDLDRAGLECWRKHVEEKFEEVTQMAEDWAERTQREGRKADAPRMNSEAAQLKKSA